MSIYRSFLGRALSSLQKEARVIVAEKGLRPNPFSPNSKLQIFVRVEGNVSDQDVMAEESSPIRVGQVEEKKLVLCQHI